MGDIAVNQSSLDRKCWNVQRQKKSFWILMSDPRRFTAGTIFYEAWMAPSNHYLHLQVNLFLKSSFLHQLNHNMTRDCSLNSQKNTNSEHVFICIDIQNNICTQQVLNLYFLGNSTNNLSSYCGLTDSRMSASDTDLPALHNFCIHNS